MGWMTALGLAIAAASAGYEASKPDPAGPRPRGGGTGIPYRGGGAGWLSKDPNSTSGGSGGGTGTPDVLGALTQNSTSEAGGPMGILATAPSMGWMGERGPGLSMDNPMGALSTGGSNPALMQYGLAGLGSGLGMLAGQKQGQGYRPPQMMMPPQQQAPPPSGGSGDQLAQLMAILEKKGLLHDPGGPKPYGMMGGYT